MSQKESLRQTRMNTVLSMVGNSANEAGDSVLSKIDAELAKHFEDRNVVLTDGGQMTFIGTSLLLTESLKLSLNQKISGASPQVIDLGSTSRAFSATGRMLYAVIDRSAGTATVTADATSLPSATSANQEVFLIAKRVDAADGTVKLIFRDGSVILSGQISRLGQTSLDSINAPSNYLTNPNAEGSTTGWSLGTATLTSNLPTGTPTFGSGASGNLSLALVSSGQLAGKGSISYVSSAATTAGNFIASDAFTIDQADQAKVLQFKFSYKAQVNPTNGNWSGTTSNSFGVAIYDVTNSLWVIPAGIFGMTQSTGVGVCTGTFQSASNGSVYRLVIYNANATAGAITLYLDRLSVSPQYITNGAIITDWKDFVGSGSWTTNTIYSVSKYRRNGDQMEVIHKIELSGAPNSSPLFINLPPGLTQDLNKVTRADSLTTVGYGQLVRTGTDTYVGIVVSASATQVQVMYSQLAATVLQDIPQVTQVAPWTWVSGNFMTLAYTLPVSGWSSNVQTSADTDTRVVAAKVFTSGTQSIPNGVWTKVTNLSNLINDTHGNFNTSTSRYVIPVSGYYAVGWSPAFLNNGTGVRAAGIIVNSSAIPTEGGAGITGSSSDVISPTFFSIRLFNAGDTLEAAVYQDAGVSLNLLAGCAMSIFRLSGPSVIASTESVNMKATQSAGQTIPNGNVDTTIIFGTKTYDTHNAYNATTGIYTVPVSGKYTIKGKLGINSTAWVQGDAVGVRIWYGPTGAVNDYTYDLTCEVNITIRKAVYWSNTFNANAGDQIRITLNSTRAGGSIVLPASATENFLLIERIGN